MTNLLYSHFVHGEVWLQATVFILVFLFLLVARLYPGYQLLAAIAYVELL